jgi:hypothetical protein
MNIGAFVLKFICRIYDRISGDTRELLVQKCAIPAQTQAVGDGVLAVADASLAAESQGIYCEPSDGELRGIVWKRCHINKNAGCNACAPSALAFAFDANSTASLPFAAESGIQLPTFIESFSVEK